MRFITEPFIFYSAALAELSAPELLYGLLAALPSDGVSGDILKLNGIAPSSAYLHLLILPRSSSHALTPNPARSTSIQILLFC